MHPTVLIIDDEPQNIELAEIVLQKEGYRLLHAEDGEVALQLLERETVSVIVLDLMMPRLDGFALLARLKGNARLAAIPVLVVTALGETAHRDRATTLGADAYLVKPYDIIDLKSRVKSMLKIGREPHPVYTAEAWLESAATWMDPHAQREIAARMLTQLDDTLLVPEAYTFLHAFGTQAYTAVGNAAVAEALRQQRYLAQSKTQDIWTALLRQLAIATVRYKAEQEGVESEAIVKALLNRS